MRPNIRPHHNIQDTNGAILRPRKNQSWMGEASTLTLQVGGVQLSASRFCFVLSLRITHVAVQHGQEQPGLRIEEALRHGSGDLDSVGEGSYL